ncbi:DUF6496 domain-containing protein [Rhizosaccharibacter radicis]|uniref:DUF6496 domain-containing protein n=1 Tax=Rhizosaccharibacter radicis TaxID=2782605 RepID=A0ABT1VXV6_9PROT|nr:DUF6496 domain-containing protein [Acetobacteraceae bacterium KSS12]
MAKQSEPQKRRIDAVMHEFKQGGLDDGHGGTVRNPKQAIAIALSEAGASNQQSPERNRSQRRDTERDAPSRDELYAEATRRKLSGRSRMTKDQLMRALDRDSGR